MASVFWQTIRRPARQALRRTARSVRLHLESLESRWVPTRIHEIQGAGFLSPLVNQNVTAVPGIVTATTQNGFFMQDPNPDDDPATSEGIFVATPFPVRVGDDVRVSGLVRDVRKGLSGASLAIPEIVQPRVTIASSGNVLPAPVILGQGGQMPPAQAIRVDSPGDVEQPDVPFDPVNNGLDFYRSLLGMRVQVNDAVVVGPGAGTSFTVLGDGGAFAANPTDRGGIAQTGDTANPERITVSGEAISTPPEVTVGDHFRGPLVGVLDYGNFGSFTMLETAPWPARTSGGLAAEVTQLTASPDQLTVATLNLQNFSPRSSSRKIANLGTVIAQDMQAPDLVALQEVENNTGPGVNTHMVVDASQTFSTLITAVQNAGGPAYRYVQIDPQFNQDGGDAGGNIRVGFLYNPARVTLIQRPGGDATTANAVVLGDDGPDLTLSPGRIDPTNPAFVNSTKPLAAEVQFNGQKMFVIVDHLLERLNDDPLFGRYQPPRTRATRVAQAQIINDFVSQILALDPNARVVALGDANDSETSPTLAALEGGQLTDLVDSVPLGRRYSLNDAGNSVALDHILISPGLQNASPEIDMVHVNTEFPAVYFRASDHDPVVARFALPAMPIGRSDRSRDRSADVELAAGQGRFVPAALVQPMRGVDNAASASDGETPAPWPGALDAPAAGMPRAEATTWHRSASRPGPDLNAGEFSLTVDEFTAPAS
jgi:predicted extracellular nuclease